MQLYRYKDDLQLDKLRYAASRKQNDIAVREPVITAVSFPAVCVSSEGPSKPAVSCDESSSSVFMHVDDEFVLENPFEGLSGLLAFGDRSSEIPKKIRLIAPNVSNMESFASPSEDVKGETWFQKFFL